MRTNRARGLLLLLFLCVLVGVLSGCQKENEKTTLAVFAAASMQNTLEEIAKNYQTSYPEIEILFHFDSSGTLKKQIEAGAECDLFLSASPKQMNQLDIAASVDENTDGLDFVVSESRVNLLENKVVLAVNASNSADVQSYEDLMEKLEAGTILMAMGNADVPVGQYTQKIFAYFGKEEEELAKKGVITYGTNVREVTTQIAEGIVDCGIVYATDAFSFGLIAVAEATKEMCGRVIYPAAVMKHSAHRREAEDFLAYLLSEEAGEVFGKVGFTPFAKE